MVPLLVAFSLAFAEPAPAESITRFHELCAVLPSGNSTSVHLATMPLPPQNFLGDVGETEELIPFEPETIADLLRRAVAPQEWEYEGRALDVRSGPNGPLLAVTAPPSVQAEVERLLDYIARSLAPSIRVRVDLYRIQGTPQEQLPAGPGGAGTAERLRALVASGGLARLHSEQLALASGHPILRMATRSTMFVRDYDVEIAEAAVIAQPMVDEYRTGLAAIYRADRSADGSVLLSFALRQAQDDGPATNMDLRSGSYVVPENGRDDMQSAGLVQVPRIAFATLCGSARLAAGTTWCAFATAPGGAGPGGTLVALALEPSETPPDAFRSGDRSFILRDVAGNAAAGVKVPRLGNRALEIESPGSEIEEHEVPLVLSIHPFGSAESGCMEGLAPQQPEDGGVDAGAISHFVYAIGPHAAAAAAVDALIARLPAPRDFGGVTFSAGKGGTIACLPAARGAAFALVGTEETYVYDYDVDVANRAAIANPNVVAAVDGIALRASAAPDSQGRFRVVASVKAHLRVGGRAEFDTGSKQLGRINQPLFSSSFSDCEVDLAAGATASCGVLEIGAEQAPLTIGALK